MRTSLENQGKRRGDPNDVGMREINLPQSAGLRWSAECGRDGANLGQVGVFLNQGAWRASHPKRYQANGGQPWLNSEGAVTVP